MAILIVNVGSTDLQVRGTHRDNGKPTNVSASGRSDAQAILDRYAEQTFIDAYDGTVLAPDVVGWPLVSKYLQWFRDRGRRLQHVVIFGTDQPETVGSRRNGDTLISAQVLARLVADHGADVVDAGGVHAAVLDVDGADRHDRCLARFQELLPEVPSAGSDRVHVAVTGGTPGANFGLLLAAQAIWGDRVEALAAREHAPAFPLDVARQMRVAFQRQPVADLFERGQFATAAEIVRSWNDDRFVPLALTAEAIRLWLDQAHDEALAHTNEATIHAGPHGWPSVNEILHDLMADLQARRGEAPVSRETELRRLTDVYWNADLCFRQERHVDFVARMALILERAIRCLIEEAINCKVPESQNARKREEFEKALTDYGLSRTEGRGLDYVAFVKIAKDIAPNHCTFGEDVADRAKRITEHADALDRLRQLRNESVVGHRLEAVTPLRVAMYVDDGLKKVFPNNGDPRGVDGVQAAIRAILGGVGHEPTGSNLFLTYGERLARALLDIPL
ncbi:MAG: hypothetical protein NTX54_01045 [Chloroflexi bacterium]|nr:hypothetical protein [Chloroflexota bacterium]